MEGTYPHLLPRRMNHHCKCCKLDLTCHVTIIFTNRILTIRRWSCEEKFEKLRSNGIHQSSRSPNGTTPFPQREGEIFNFINYSMLILQILLLAKRKSKGWGNWLCQYNDHQVFKSWQQILTLIIFVILIFINIWNP